MIDGLIVARGRAGAVDHANVRERDDARVDLNELPYGGGYGGALSNEGRRRRHDHHTRKNGESHGDDDTAGLVRSRDVVCGDQRLWPDRLESVGRRTPPPNPSLGLRAPGRVPPLREPAA